MNPWIIVAIVAACVLALVGACVLFYYYGLPKVVLHKMTSSPNPDGEMTYPAHFDDLKARTTLAKDLTYPSAYPSNGFNLYIPSEHSKKVPLIIWVHGGGFIGGSKDGGDNVMTALCAAGYAIASIDYAVAPKHRCPTAVRQVAEFAAHLPTLLAAHPEINGERIVFGGDSAGAQIAAQYVLTQTNPTYSAKMGIPAILHGRIKAATLVCGPFDFLSIRAYAKRTNRMFRVLVDIWGRVYFGKIRWYKSETARQTSIAAHVTESFPAVFLTDGNKGSFEAQNRKLAETCREKGVTVEELYFDPQLGDVPHEYLFHLHEENSLLCLDRMVEFLDKNV